MVACLWGAGVDVRAQEAPPADGEGAAPVYVPDSSPRRGSAAEPSTPAPTGAGAPGLADLLQLPSDFVVERSRPVAGATEGEWRRRFERASEELAEARTKLESTKRELDEIAETGGASQWSVAPPGGGNAAPTASPLSFKLRQELQRNRERVEAATRALRELRIEADLAGVPPGWRTAEGQTSGALPPE